jgi:O-antigen ligase
MLLLAYAIITGAAAASLVSQSGRRVTLCLALFCAGFALCGVTFWGIKLGISNMVQDFDTTIYGASSADSLRFGSARGNPGMLGPPMSLSILGLCGVALAAASRTRAGERRWPTQALLIGTLVCGLPPLVGAGVRTGFVALGLGIALWAIYGGETVAVSGSARISALLGLSIGATALIIVWHPLNLGAYWHETVTRQEQQGGLRDPIGGRINEWRAGWDSVMSSPLIGTGGKPVVRYSYFADPALWASHNTYLDVGMLGGLPALILYIIFLSRPLSRLWHYRTDGPCLAMLATYAAACVVIAGNSALQMKHVWILWPLAAMQAAAMEAQEVARPVRPRRTRSRLPRSGTEALAPS